MDESKIHFSLLSALENVSSWDRWGFEIVLITKWAAEVARQLCGFIFHLNSVGLHEFLCCFLARSASHTTAHDDSPSQLGHISYSLASSHVCCFSLQCRRTENLCVGFAHRSMSVFFPQVVRFFQNGAWSWGERVLCRICNALQLIWKACSRHSNRNVPNPFCGYSDVLTFRPSSNFLT